MHKNLLKLGAAALLISAAASCTSHNTLTKKEILSITGYAGNGDIGKSRTIQR